jgi:hypothetical protein
LERNIFGLAVVWGVVNDQDIEPRIIEPTDRLETAIELFGAITRTDYDRARGLEMVGLLRTHVEPLSRLRVGFNLAQLFLLESDAAKEPTQPISPKIRHLTTIFVYSKWIARLQGEPPSDANQALLTFKRAAGAKDESGGLALVANCARRMILSCSDE